MSDRRSESAGRVIAVVAALAALCPLLAHAQPTHRLDDDKGDFVQLDEPDPNTSAGQIQLIRRLLVAGKARKAEREADDWIQDNPLDPLVVEAILIRGDAKVAQEDYYRSLEDYEIIILQYAGTEYYRAALQREYDIAKLFIGGLYRRSAWFNIRILPSQDVGIELLIRIQERLPQSALGERASIAIGDYYFSIGDMEMAAEGYDLFLANYPNSRQREWAMLRQIQASLARYKGPEFDASGLTDASQRLRDYANEFPAAAEKIGAERLMVRINESLAEKKLVTARWYEKRGLPRAAITTYRRVITAYPGSNAAQQALAELNERGEPVVDPRGPLAKAARRDAENNPADAADE